ncbi:MAG TPA: phage holin family protein [Streptosporangiaceae bacterium]
MAEPALHGRTEASQESLGDLVALAVSDITQLVRYEVDLAKIELKADARRVGIGAVLLGIAAFVGCLVLMLACFACAYGLAAAGAPGGLWGGFLWAALTCVVLAAIAIFVGITRFRGLSGLRKTRSTVSDDLAMIRRDDGQVSGPAGAR